MSLDQSSLTTRTQLLVIEEQVSLADKNWFGTGGSARYFCQPRSAQEFAYALDFAHQKNLPIFVLGEGANVLVSDEGFPGLVINPKLENVIIVERHDATIMVQADAGLSMDALIEFCLANNSVGLEEFSGIPGTVGGSVFINLHYFEFLLSDFLVSATVINAATGHLMQVDKAWFKFGYNQSSLQNASYYLLNATFALRTASSYYDIAFAQGRRREIIRHRVKRYPSKGTCGSFFRNFLPEEVHLVSNDKKMIYVAYYLDKIGIKGELRIGDAMVSYQHANMLVNCGAATSADLIALARSMQEKVYKAFGIVPQPECRLIGFSTYPLL